MKELEEIIESIKVERQNQIDKGYNPEHDSKYQNGELLLAALVLAGYANGQNTKKEETLKIAKEMWPFGEFIPNDSDITNMIKACSLIIAEIQRILK
jgi:hypothetical protein